MIARRLCWGYCRTLGNVRQGHAIALAQPRNETHVLSLMPTLWVKSGTGREAGLRRATALDRITYVILRRSKIEAC